MIFAALAMLALAATALPMAIIALSRSAQKTSDGDGVTAVATVGDDRSEL
ncbi:hypothetical protein [Kutzneria buriramensis]|uniref:Uncharacterized protein n=1 Tax=Kutzneria buriramensis TaxID=1045776 RepID=A0A3E0HTN2_9PSEU|nr:hypothetical protein [Kutzneria buriramensis]REH49779.1 hypothetical protein BCF44_10442 [Kutzneria buriramensis]